MISEELKYQIVAGARDYAEQKGISQPDIVRMAGINGSYLSLMFRNMFSSTVEGKDTPIGDKWFFKLAEWCGYAIQKQYWEPVKTRQFTQIIHRLEMAKRESMVATLIAETGCGKTYVIDRFMGMNPVHTYKITVTSTDSLRDILNEIAFKLGTPQRDTKSRILRWIIEKIKELKRMGHNPLLIIDEAENSKLPVIQMLKGLYDGVIGYGSIVLIGTSQLTDALWRMKMSNRSGAPQFYRRIKAGIINISSDRDFTPFFEKYVEDKGLRKLLNERCENYGELHDYLEPVLRKAFEEEIKLTEMLFRLHHNIAA